MSTEILYRTGTICRDVVDEEPRKVELSLNSETSVERVFGNEVLGHSDDAVDLQRLNNASGIC